MFHTVSVLVSISSLSPCVARTKAHHRHTDPWSTEVAMKIMYLPALSILVKLRALAKMNSRFVQSVTEAMAIFLFLVSGSPYDLYKMAMGSGDHQCPECGKRYKNQSSLSRHLRYGCGKLKCVCPHCGRYYSRTDTLAEHVARMHTRLLDLKILDDLARR